MHREARVIPGIPHRFSPPQWRELAEIFGSGETTSASFLSESPSASVTQLGEVSITPRFFHLGISSLCEPESERKGKKEIKMPRTEHSGSPSVTRERSPPPSIEHVDTIALAAAALPVDEVYNISLQVSQNTGLSGYFFDLIAHVAVVGRQNKERCHIYSMVSQLSLSLSLSHTHTLTLTLTQTHVCVLRTYMSVDVCAHLFL